MLCDLCETISCSTNTVIMSLLDQGKARGFSKNTVIIWSGQSQRLLHKFLSDLGKNKSFSTNTVVVWHLKSRGYSTNTVLFRHGQSRGLLYKQWRYLNLTKSGAALQRPLLSNLVSDPLPKYFWNTLVSQQHEI